MDEATRTHIFEPFFTARIGAPGSGLGLAAVYGITKQHAGYIAVESAPGDGTTFAVYFPAVADAPPVPSIGAPPSGRAGTETVLLVDDEDEVRELMRDILESHGYRVIEAGHPDVALAVIEQNPATAIDLILTDVQMPSMSGRALVDRIAAIRPGVRALYVSGYSAEILGREGVLSTDVALVEKPFTVLSLLGKIREALGR
jgi:CheY-like chemotaxis protein